MLSNLFHELLSCLFSLLVSKHMVSLKDTIISLISDFLAMWLEGIIYLM